MLQQLFSFEQIDRIQRQSLDFQCACPAQVCGTIVDLRELYAYQANCLQDADTDRKVHEFIASSVRTAHAAMETCLKEVLALEGWDPVLLDLPESLKARPIKEV